MKITQTSLAQAIRFGATKPHQGNALYGRNLVRAFEEKYGFMESPKTVADFDLNKGITFSHGYFENRMVIEKIIIYINGIVVETKESTDDCLKIMKEVVSWGAEHGGVIFEENVEYPQLYLSHFEVEMSVDIQKVSKKLQAISDAINGYMISYKEVGRDFRCSSLSFQLDPATSGPTAFKFERRNAQSFSSNLYFSAAPLKSQDHIGLLGLMEEFFSS
jgi:hypothetical protein